MYTTKDSLRLQIQRTQEQLAKMQVELEHLDNPYGAEPPPGTDIMWRQRYDGSKAYTFLAHLAADGRWYTTSKYNTTRTWRELCAEWKKRNVTADAVLLLRAEDTLHLRKMRQQ